MALKDEEPPLPDTSEAPLDDIEEEPYVEDYAQEEVDDPFQPTIEPDQSMECPEDEYQDVDDESPIPPPDMIDQQQLDAAGQSFEDLVDLNALDAKSAKLQPESNLQVNENNMQSSGYRGATGLSMKSIIGASTEILQSLQADQKADETNQKTISLEEDQLKKDFQALDEDYEVKSHDFAQAYLRKAGKAGKQSEQEVKQNSTSSEDPLKVLKNALDGKAPEPMSSGSLNSINFRNILQSSEEVLNDLSGTNDEKRFLRDLRKINDLNNKRYDSELKAHGKRQDQMKLMLVKEKIQQIKERQKQEREGVVGLAAGTALGNLVGDVKDEVIAQSSGLEDLSKQFNTEMDKISDAFIVKAQLNQTTVTPGLGALEQKQKNQLVDKLVAKTLSETKEQAHVNLTTKQEGLKGAADRLKKKSIKEMKKEQKNIKKQVKQIRTMLSKKDEETEKLKKQLDAYKKQFGEMSFAEKEPSHTDEQNVLKEEEKHEKHSHKKKNKKKGSKKKEGKHKQKHSRKSDHEE